MTNEQLAAAVLEVKRLNEAMDSLPAEVSWKQLLDAHEYAKMLAENLRRATQEAVEAEAEHKVWDFVEYKGGLCTVLAVKPGRLGVEYILELTAFDPGKTHGYPFLATGPINRARLDDCWYDLNDSKWRLKPSGTASV